MLVLDSHEKKDWGTYSLPSLGSSPSCPHHTPAHGGLWVWELQFIPPTSKPDLSAEVVMCHPAVAPPQPEPESCVLRHFAPHRPDASMWAMGCAQECVPGRLRWEAPKKVRKIHLGRSHSTRGPGERAKPVGQTPVALPRGHPSSGTFTPPGAEAERRSASPVKAHVCPLSTPSPWKMPGFPLPLPTVATVSASPLSPRPSLGQRDMKTDGHLRTAQAVPNVSHFNAFLFHKIPVGSSVLLPL